MKRTAPALPELPDDPADGAALRYLGQDLYLAGRNVEARVVLDRAADLIERALAAVRPERIDGSTVARIWSSRW